MLIFLESWGGSNMSLIASPFAEVPAAPADPILGLTEAYNADANPVRVNLGVGVYQDESGKIPVLEVVREAESRWLATENSKGYLPIDGVPAYNRQVQGLLFGSGSPVHAGGLAVTVQAPGGTGALRVGADFLKAFHPKAKLFVTRPTWANHQGIFEAAGFEVGEYSYYDPATHGLDFDGMMAGLRAVPDGSVILLHACCHNPSGVDPTPAQWQKIVRLFQERPLTPFLDFAYQGLGAGIDPDAVAVRAFAAAGLPCLIASSFSKSFSLYRERVGALTILAATADEARRVLSQVKRIVRVNYSNPPSHGAQVVALILDDPDLRPRWEIELGGMRDRIQHMRRLFVNTLREEGVTQDFGFIKSQQGMFSFSGLTKEQVQRLRQEFSIYIVNSGRICVAAMTSKNMPYICSSIAKVL
jgi:aromatic-amino-acid transaminase